MTEKMKFGNNKATKKALSEVGTKARDNLTSLQVMLPPETHAKFKALCSLRQVKMTAVTTELIEKWIDEQIKSNPWLKGS